MKTAKYRQRTITTILSALTSTVFMFSLTASESTKQEPSATSQAGVENAMTIPDPTPLFKATNTGEDALPHYEERSTMRSKIQRGIYCGANSIFAATEKQKDGSNKDYLYYKINNKHFGFWIYGTAGNASDFAFSKSNGIRQPDMVYEKKDNAVFASRTVEILPGIKAVYSHGAEILPDGKIQVHYGFLNPAELNGTPVGGTINSSIPFSPGTEIIVDNKTLVVPTEPMQEQDELLLAESAHEVIFMEQGKVILYFEFPDNNKISLLVQKNPETNLAENINFKISTKNDKITFLIDLKSGQKISAAEIRDQAHGNTFYRSTRLISQDYSKSRNLFHNPSFEGGLRYYTLDHSWKRLSINKPDPFTVCASIAKFGKKSMQITLEDGDGNQGFLKAFSVPLKMGKDYVLSFWAKSDCNDFFLRIGSRPMAIEKTISYPENEQIHVPHPHYSGPGIKLSSEWKRYHVRFSASNPYYSLLLGPVYTGNGIGHAYIDGLQLEEGTELTDYTEKPFCSFLTTSDPDNFLNSDNPNIDAVLNIESAPATRGKAACIIENYFGEQIWKNEFNFEASNDGSAKIPLQLEGILAQGIYVLRSDISLDNGFSDYDFFRITRMKFLEGKNKNKEYLSTHEGTVRGPYCEKVCERLYHTGWGEIAASEHFLAKDPFDNIDTNRELHNIASKWGIYADAGFLHGLIGSVCYKNPAVKDCSSAGDRYWEWTCSIEYVTPELIQEVERLSCEAANKMPWIKYWDFRREMEGMHLMRNRKYKDMADLLAAAYRGIKKGNPNAQFRVGDTSNLSDLKYTQTYLDILEKYHHIKPDSITSNHYRLSTTPEGKGRDFDIEARNFVELAEKYGLKAAIHFPEGMYWEHPFPRFAKEWGSKNDNFRAAYPSYHMNAPEKLYAAFTAREWIMGMKYSQIKRVNQWENTFFDFNLTCTPNSKIVNTLGNLMDEVTFYKDLRFAPNIRCLLFKDPKDCPVIAIWSHVDDVDFMKVDAPKFHFDFKNIVPEFYDLMGNKRICKFDQNGFAIVPVTSYPLIMKGKAGRIDDYAGALIKGKTDFNLGSLLAFEPKIIDDKTISLHITSFMPEDTDLLIKTSNDTNDLECHTEISTGKSADIQIPLPAQLSADNIATINVPLSVDEGSNTNKLDFSFDGFIVKKAQNPLSLNSTEKEWEQFPLLTMKNKSLPIEYAKKISEYENEGYPGDFDVNFRMGWDENNLYLRIYVNDDQFFGKENQVYQPGYLWENDSFQIYVDTLSNADRLNKSGLSRKDDLSLAFYPKQDGSIDIYRLQMPDIQLQGGVACAKHSGTWVEKELMQADMTKTKDGYIYTAVISGKNLPPMILEKGALAGFCLLVNDNDGEKTRKSLRTLSPAGTDGCGKPYQWPIILLGE